MAVMLKCGAIFLHIPKTGGSWVTRMLREQDLIRREFSHIHADMVRVRYYASGTQTVWRSSFEWAKSLVPRRWKAAPWVQNVKKSQEQAADARFPFTFCFVRHPLRWYESWWRYMCGRSGTDWAAESDLMSWHPCGPIRTTGDASFDRFVANVNAIAPGFVTYLYGLYTQTGIGFVGRQERLADDLISVLSRLNVGYDEQQIRESAPVNVSQNALTAEWNQERRRQTSRLEYAGLVRYGYDVGECE